MHYRIESSNSGSDVTLVCSSPVSGIDFVTFNVKFDEAVVPEKIKIKFSIPTIDEYSVFSPSLRELRNLNPSWRKRTTPSRIASRIPVRSIVSLGGMIFVKNKAESI